MLIPHAIYMWISSNGIVFSKCHFDTSSQMVLIHGDDEAKFLNGAHFHTLLLNFAEKTKDVELIQYLAIHQLAPGINISTVKANMHIIVPALRGIGLVIDKSHRNRIEALGYLFIYLFQWKCHIGILLLKKLRQYQKY
jgi:hypothetical protein